MDRPLAAAPDTPVDVPDAVRALAGGDEVTPVWRNILGGLTFRLDGGAGTRYAKWAPAGTPELDLDAEARRLAWAAPCTSVPQVLDVGSDDTGAWLVTAEVPGTSAVAPRWVAEPETAARAIGAGLRAMHDALPVDDCPFTWSAEERIDRVPAESRHLVANVPSTDRLVVCHGDPCAPNTLVADDGTWSAHVDLGSLGTGDRWADLAVASYSLEWNYGEGHEAAFFDAYGIDADPERIAFYRLLWDLS